MRELGKQFFREPPTAGAKALRQESQSVSEEQARACFYHREQYLHSVEGKGWEWNEELGFFN